jgi:large subunit ribosomal protein L25
MAQTKPILLAEKREVVGKKVKKLRGRGKLPGVVYGKGVTPELVSVGAKEFRRLYHEVGGNTLVLLQLDEDKHNVLIHEPARNPVTDEEIHVDFYRVNMSEKITTEVPLHFEGEAPAVRSLEGTLIRPLDSVEVECLPGDLPHAIEISLDGLVDFEAAIHVNDLSVPAGVEILNDPEEVLAKVEPPRSEEELEELEEAPAEEEALPEVEGETPEGEEAPNAEEATTEPNSEGTEANS